MDQRTASSVGSQRAFKGDIRGYIWWIITVKKLFETVPQLAVDAHSGRDGPKLHGYTPGICTRVTWMQLPTHLKELYA